MLHDSTALQEDEAKHPVGATAQVALRWCFAANLTCAETVKAVAVAVHFQVPVAEGRKPPLTRAVMRIVQQGSMILSAWTEHFHPLSVSMRLAERPPDPSASSGCLAT